LRRPLGAKQRCRERIFSYSPHPDGQRFLVNAPADESEPMINVITHWQQMISATEAR
jgi:hypothetical protein